jgi:hypothetical protein
LLVAAAQTTTGFVVLLASLSPTQQTFVVRSLIRMQLTIMRTSGCAGACRRATQQQRRGAGAANRTRDVTRSSCGAGYRTMKLFASHGVVQARSSSSSSSSSSRRSALVAAAAAAAAGGSVGAAAAAAEQLEASVQLTDAQLRDAAVAFAKVADDTKATDISLLHVEPVVSWTSYMLLCTGVRVCARVCLHERWLCCAPRTAACL